MATQVTPRAKCEREEPELVADVLRPPPPSEGAEAENHEKIAELAYELWQARGCPYGSPENDWFRAEEQLEAHNEPADVD